MSVIQLAHGALVIDGSESILDRGEIRFSIVGEGNRQDGSRVGLIDEVSAALEVQAELEAQRARLGSIDAGHPGYRDMDFRQSQRDGRNGQHCQDENRQ